MKKLIALSVIAITCSITQAAAAFVIWSNGVEIQKVQKLDEPIIVNKIVYENLGIYFNQFSLFFIPIWNYGDDPEYMLYNTKGKSIFAKCDKYIPITAETAEVIKNRYNLNIDAYNPKLSFWNKWFGKIILVIIIGFVVHCVFSED